MHAIWGSVSHLRLRDHPTWALKFACRRIIQWVIFFGEVTVFTLVEKESERKNTFCEISSFVTRSLCCAQQTTAYTMALERTFGGRGGLGSLSNLSCIE